MGAAGRLGDSAARDYTLKLRQFHAFAAPELRQLLAELPLTPGMRVLDVGCGTGETLALLRERVGAAGLVVGLDLAAAHARAAALTQGAHAAVLQADATHVPLGAGTLDLVFSLNTVHHLPDPLAALRHWCTLLRPGGWLALAQSSLLPDMLFAWDERLERRVTEAVRAYYRARYGQSERDLTAVRGLVGLLRGLPLQALQVRSLLIERTSPLAAADEAYLLETQFRGTWGARLRPYLAADDYAALERLCDPSGPDYALRRPDFHLLQSLTLARARLPQRTSQKQ